MALRNLYICTLYYSTLLVYNTLYIHIHILSFIEQIQLAYQQAQSTYNNSTNTPPTNHAIVSTSSVPVPYVADYTLFVKNTLEMTEKQLSTRKKTNEANATSNINPSTAAKKRKKSSPNTTPTTSAIADNNDSNNSITVLPPTINSESLTPAHTQPLIGADILSIPRIGTKAVAALLAYIGGTTGRRIVEELLVEVTVRPYATGTTGTATTDTTSTGIGKQQQQQQQQQQVNELLTKGMISDTMTSDNIELINVIQSDNNNDDNDDDVNTNQVISDSATTNSNTLDFIITATPTPTNSTNDGDISISTSISNAKSKSKSSNVNRSIVSKSYLPLLKEVVVFTGKFSSMTRSGAGAVSETLGTR